MVDGRLLLEYSKSARAACPLCGATIAKGIVRIGRQSMLNGFSQTKWHHIECFGEHNSETDFVQTSGFLSLKASDQEALRSIKLKVKERESSAMGSQGLQSPAAKVGLVQALAAATSFDGFNPSKLSDSYRDVRLPQGWKSFSTLILNEANDVRPSEKIAAFDFDGTLANTNVRRQGADAWDLLYKSIPEKLAEYHNDGYKLVIFTNESNIDRFINARAKAIASKLGRLKGFMQIAKLPMQVFIACGKSGANDAFRKPATGMWGVLKDHLNNGIPIDMSRSFYVGDAAGRKKDHSDADIKFAQVLGLKFLFPEEVFSAELQTPTKQVFVDKTTSHQEQQTTAVEGTHQSGTEDISQRNQAETKAAASDDVQRESFVEGTLNQISPETP